jgi:tRNA modification GTPase
MSADAVAILLTGPGPAAIGVVRLSGPGVEAFLREHFSKPVINGRCLHGNVIEAQRVIDDVIVALAPDGAWADVNLHGGPWVVRSFLELAARGGFDVIERLSFPLPEGAVDADSPLDREVLSYLPLARTELGVRVLLGQPHAWDRLKKQRLTGDASDELRRIAQDATLNHLLDPPRVAIVGAANVGKSTLANQLFGQERSITADMAGTTRDWVGEIANIDGLPVVLVDTPGLRKTDDPIERTAIERSRNEIESAALVLLVLDAARPLESDQAALIDRFPQALRVTNKSDRPKAWDTSSIQSVRTVATTGEGLQALRDRIVRHFCGDAPSPDRAYCWTERQRRIILREQRGAAGALQEL